MRSKENISDYVFLVFTAFLTIGCDKFPTLQNKLLFLDNDTIEVAMNFSFRNRNSVYFSMDTDSNLHGTFNIRIGEKIYKYSVIESATGEYICEKAEVKDTIFINSVLLHIYPEDPGYTIETIFFFDAIVIKDEIDNNIWKESESDKNYIRFYDINLTKYKKQYRKIKSKGDLLYIFPQLLISNSGKIELRF